MSDSSSDMKMDFSQKWVHPITGEEMIENASVSIVEEQKMMVADLKLQWGIDADSVLGKAGSKEIEFKINKKRIDAIWEYALKWKRLAEPRSIAEFREILEKFASDADGNHLKLYVTPRMCYLLDKEDFPESAIMMGNDVAFKLLRVLNMKDGQTQCEMFIMPDSYFNQTEAVIYDEDKPKDCLVLMYKEK